MIRRESSSAPRTRGTSTRMSMTLASSPRSASIRARQLELLLEHPAADPALDPGAQRLDQDDDRGRRQQRVEEEEPRLVGADPADHHAVDEGEDEDQRPQHHHAPEQLVEIEQPVADEVLRQEVEVDDDEDVAEARPVRDRLDDRGGDGGEAADQEIEQPLLLHPRRRRPVAAIEIEDRQVEAGEHVGHEGDVERQRRVHRLDEAREEQDAVEDRRAEHGRSAERRRSRLVAEEGLKEALRRGRQRDGRQQRGPVPQRRLEPLGDERQRAVERDVEGERGEEDVRAAARLPQKDRAPEREGDDGRDQRGDRLNAQSAGILAQMAADACASPGRALQSAFCRARGGLLCSEGDQRCGPGAQSALPADSRHQRPARVLAAVPGRRARRRPRVQDLRLRQLGGAVGARSTTAT